MHDSHGDVRQEEEAGRRGEDRRHTHRSRASDRGQSVAREKDLGSLRESDLKTNGPDVRRS